MRKQWMFKMIGAGLLSVLASACTTVESDRAGCGEIVPGGKWFDTDGNRIQAHGGGIMVKDGVYYWYGEDKTLGNFARVGVSCYSSTDLTTWKHEGVVFSKTELPEDLQDTKGVCERPKVIYNPKTKQYVMWMHLDDRVYKVAAAGIAVSDSPAGPFKYLKQIRPIRYDYGYPEKDRTSQAELGNTYRDMNLFVDDDGEAYVFYSSEDNVTMYICRLNDDFTDIVRPAVEGKTWSRNLVNELREAPAPFKFRGKYYIVSSGCTGWAPNPASYAVADHILGPWKSVEDPCIGPEAKTTFRSQSTFVVPAPGKPDGCFIYMGDRWLSWRLEDSRYVWLPFVMDDDHKIMLEYYPHWNMSVFDQEPFDTTVEPALQAALCREEDYSLLGVKLTWNPVEGADLYRIYRNGVYTGTSKEIVYRDLGLDQGRFFTYEVQAVTVHGEASQKSNRIQMATIVGPRTTVSLGDWTPDTASQDFGTLGRNTAFDGGPLVIGERTFEKGLGTHANSSISYNLFGGFKTFTSVIGVNGKMPGASVVFSVLCDGEERFKSPVMTANSEPLPITVDLRGVNELKLVVTDGGNGISCDHANWADATIE
jgi:hypothetical protein